MARILFYGGCHARVLSDLFTRYCRNPEHSFEKLTNYVLIQKGIEFPYEHVRTFDVVVFNPIKHRPGYRTEDLLPFLQANRIRCVSYPWLEWRGYFPTIVKSASFLGVWSYPLLRALAGRFADAPAFVRAVMSGASEMQAVRDAAMADVAATTQALAAHEAEHQVDVPVSGFIEQNFRRSRLFMTPDHPSIDLYRYVARAIAGRLGIDLVRDLDFVGTEPHPSYRVPILPFLYDELGLQFRDSDYQFDETFGTNQRIELSRYLLLLYAHVHHWSILRATEPTMLKATKDKSWMLAEDQKRAVAGGQILVGRLIEDADDHFRIGDVMLDGEPAFDCAYVYKPSWQLVNAA